MNFWTDYPIVELGDEPGKEAPIRQVTPLEYDGDKYVWAKVKGDGRIVRVEIKAGYIYTKKGRSGEVPTISAALLDALTPMMRITKANLCKWRKEWYPRGSGPLGVMRVIVKLIDAVARDKGWDLSDDKPE